MSTKRRWPQWVAALAVALACVVAGPSKGRAESAQKLLEQAREFPDRVERLKTQYLKPAILESKFTVETRFNDARVAYMLEDYDRASLLFADIVRSPDFKGFESARRALYLLGDSLFQQRNYLAAKKYFQRLVERGQGSHYQDAVVRLLKIAARTGEYRGVEKLYDRFSDEREMGPAVQYMRGKTLYTQDKPGEAVPFLTRAAKSKEWKWRALYIKGVALAEKGNYSRARKIFRRLTKHIDAEEGSRAREIKHLSYLALGRVAYERRNIEQAINFYQQLPRKSEHFGRALYELTWVLVSRESYEAASRNADIFLYLANPDPTFIPEVKLLKADLLLRTDKYRRAKLAYRDVIDQFQPIKRRMKKFLTGKRDIGKFFRRLVRQEFRGENPIYMPKTVQKWIDRGKELKEARQLVRDVATIQQDIKRTQQAIQQMKARIRSGSTLDSFPSLAEGMTVGIETDHQLIRLQRKLLRKEYQILKSTMNSSERSRWKKMQSELDSFQNKYEKVPKTQQAVRKRTRKVEQQFAALKEKLDTVAYMLKGQKEQLRGINEYIQENYEKGLSGMPKEKRQKTRALRKEVRRRIRKLEKREEQLRKRVAVVRQKVGVGDRVTRQERKLRQQYREKIAERRRYLKQFHGRVSGANSSKLRTISRARSHLRPATRELRVFFTKMREIVDEKSDDLRRKIEREEKILAERRKRLNTMMRESKNEAAKAALKNYVRVREKFDEIVMRGDVGLLDVVWQKKQETTDQLNQVRQNRRRELKQLQQSFQEVR